MRLSVRLLMFARTRGVGAQRRDVALSLFELGLQPDVHVVHQMRKQCECEGDRGAVLFGT